MFKVKNNIKCVPLQIITQKQITREQGWGSGQESTWPENSNDREVLVDYACFPGIMITAENPAQIFASGAGAINMQQTLLSMHLNRPFHRFLSIFFMDKSRKIRRLRCKERGK